MIAENIEFLFLHYLIYCGKNFKNRCGVNMNYPEAIGPYSASRQAGNIIVLSGQLPIDPKTNLFAGETIEEQTKQSILNIKAILDEKGCSLKDIIKTTVYLKNMSDFNSMNRIYESFFEKPYPSRTAVAVKELPKNALVEIEVMAWQEK